MVELWLFLLSWGPLKLIVKAKDSQTLDFFPYKKDSGLTGYSNKKYA